MNAIKGEEAIKSKDKQLPIEKIELSEQEIIEESNWILKKFRLLDSHKEKINNANLVEHRDCIQNVLKLIYNDKYEIMSIYYQFQNLFMPLLDLDDLWLIYEMDLKYIEFIKKKNYVKIKYNEYKEALNLQNYQVDQELSEINYLDEASEIY